MSNAQMKKEEDFRKFISEESILRERRTPSRSLDNPNEIYQNTYYKSISQYIYEWLYHFLY